MYIYKRMVERLRKNWTRCILLSLLAIVALTAVVEFLVVTSQNDLSNGWPWLHPKQPQPINTANNFEISPPNYLWNNQNLCQKFASHRKTMAIIILSARDNFQRRQLIRETWGSIRDFGGWKIVIVFMLGQPRPTEEDWIELKLRSERRKYDDLIKKDFVDSYRNLTLKAVMAYEWIVEFCPLVKIIVKVDDDVFVNIFELARALNENPSIERTLNFYGQILKNKIPSRDKTDPWFVTWKEFNKSVYPPYCRGLGYVTTLGVIQKIVKVIPDYGKGFWIEDIFLTGILPRQINSEIREKIEKYGKRLGEERVREMEAGRIRHFERNWFFSGDLGDRSVKLREWYSSNGELVANGSSGGVFGTFRHKVLSTIFFLIDHGQYFSQDFKALWVKLRQIEGLDSVESS